MLDHNYRQIGILVSLKLDEFIQSIIKCCDEYINNDKMNYIPYIRKGNSFYKNSIIFTIN